MSGSDIGSLKSMLASAFTKAAEAKEKAAGKTPDGGAKTAAAPARNPSDPAVLLSATLDDFARPGVEQTDGALDSRQGAPEYDDAFAGQLGQVMDAMGRDLGRMLAAFGLEEETVEEAVKGFTGRFGEDDRKAAFGRIDGPPGEARPLTVSSAEHHETTAVSVEVADVELTLQQGGKSLTLSFDRSSLSMARVSESAHAANDGKTAVTGAERSTTALHARSQGLTIRADGFDADELDGIMQALQGGMTGRPEALEEAATLTPKGAPGADGTMSLSLDLKGLLTTAFGREGARAAKSMGQDIRKQGFDVRI